MKTVGNKRTGVVSYDIYDLTPAEMDAMLEAREMLRANLINHKSNDESNKKKEYLSDEQLKDIFRILVRLTGDREKCSSNSFKSVDLDVELDPEKLHTKKEQESDEPF